MNAIVDNGFPLFLRCFYNYQIKNFLCGGASNLKIFCHCFFQQVLQGAAYYGIHKLAFDHINPLLKQRNITLISKEIDGAVPLATWYFISVIHQGPLLYEHSKLSDTKCLQTFLSTFHMIAMIGGSLFAAKKANSTRIFRQISCGCALGCLQILFQKLIPQLSLVHPKIASYVNPSSNE